MLFFRLTFWILSLFCLILISGCGEKFLDIKHEKSLVIPKTIDDYQSILEYKIVTSSHEFAIAGADEYFLTDAKWDYFQSQYSSFYCDLYIWSKANPMAGFDEYSFPDWPIAYTQIFYSNQALAGLEKIKPAAHEKEAYDLAKGAALFLRAMRYYQLAQLFCPVYTEANLTSPFGLPLRLEPDVTAKVRRSNLGDTYNRILADALEAAALLPQESDRQNHRRPSKAAAYGLLAKIYLVMEKYEEACKYASLCLELRPELLDFNSLVLTESSVTAPFTFENFSPTGVDNPEMLFYLSLEGSRNSAFSTFHGGIDTALFQSYEENDLRKTAFFRPQTETGDVQSFRGSYTGNNIYFTGMATDEQYLIRAETHARAGRVTEAMADLNHLLKHRYDNDHFTPRSASTRDAALDQILAERRKQLLFRGIRWEDLRRLNNDPNRAVTLTRVVHGQVNELPPNDVRYMWPLPQSEIDGAGVTQNPR